MEKGKRTLGFSEFAKDLGAHIAYMQSGGKTGKRADFTDCILPKIDLEQQRKFYELTRSGRASAGDIILQGLSFRNAEIPDSLLDRMQFYDCDFSGASLAKTKIRSCTFSDCRFSRTKADSISIERSVIQNSVFDEASIRRSFIHNGTNFEFCHFKNHTRFTDGTRMTGMNFYGCEFQQSIFQRVSLSKDVSFGFCHIEDSQFLFSNFSRTSFQQGELQDSRIYDCNFSNACFELVEGDNLDVLNTNLETAQLGDMFPDIHQTSIELRQKDGTIRIPVSLNLQDGYITSKELEPFFPRDEKGRARKSIPLRTLQELIQHDKISIRRPQRLHDLPRLFHEYRTCRSVKKQLLAACRSLQETYTMHKKLDLENQK